jgi:hypothetical protein
MCCKVAPLGKALLDVSSGRGGATLLARIMPPLDTEVPYTN